MHDGLAATGLLMLVRCSDSTSRLDRQPAEAKGLCRTLDSPPISGDDARPLSMGHQ